MSVEVFNRQEPIVVLSSSALKFVVSLDYHFRVVSIFLGVLA